MQVGIITLFPDMFDALRYGVVGRAIENNIVAIRSWNPRDYTQDKHRTVDDKPYGGGPGMLMKVQPLQDAIRAAKQELGDDTQVIYVSPKGKRFDQQAAIQLSCQRKMIFLAGRYEGVDERLIQTEVDAQWSVGDYVLSGGEFAIMTMLDAMVRLLPGVLGDAESAKADSFMQGLLDFPHYTRPATINGLRVPEVLMSGDHAAIAKWRMKQALGGTWLHRPDLLGRLTLDAEQQALLCEFKEELRKKT